MVGCLRVWYTLIEHLLDLEDDADEMFEMEPVVDQLQCQSSEIFK